MINKLKCGAFAGAMILVFSLLCITPTIATCDDEKTDCVVASRSAAESSQDELIGSTAEVSGVAVVPSTSSFANGDETILLSNSGLIITIIVLSLVCASYGVAKHFRQ